jgi:hypothetical protein
MKMANHTPGPWEITGRRANHPDYPYYWAISAPKWLEFARVVVRLSDDGEAPDAEDYPEGVANANLIAAAPELLDVAKDARSVLRIVDRSDAWRAERNRVLAALEAAIAKASEQSSGDCSRG